MKARVSIVVAGVISGLGSLAPPSCAQVDPFHEVVERDARAAAGRGDAATAARLFRIACFGMLDDPARLAACSSRLALAQYGAGDREGFRETWSRLAVVEQRFGAVSRADLLDAERLSLARAGAAWLERETLLAIPALAELATSRSPPPGGDRGSRQRARPKREGAGRGQGEGAAPAAEEIEGQSEAPPAQAVPRAQSQVGGAPAPASTGVGDPSLRSSGAGIDPGPAPIAVRTGVVPAAQGDLVGAALAPAPVRAAAPVAGAEVPAPARASRILGFEPQVSGDRTVVVVRADAPFRQDDISDVRMEAPPRWLVRLFGITQLPTPSTLPIDSELVRRVRTGLHESPRGLELHLVLDLTDAPVRFSWESEGEILRLRVAKAAL